MCYLTKPDRYWQDIPANYQKQILGTLASYCYHPGPLVNWKVRQVIYLSSLLHPKIAIAVEKLFRDAEISEGI